MRDIIAIVEDTATDGLGEHKYWIGLGDGSRIDNHDMDAEDAYASSADEDDELYGDWRGMAFRDGAIRLNIARRRGNAEFGAEYEPDHVSSASLRELLEWLEDETNIDVFYINNETFTDVRQASRTVTQDLLVARRAGR